jgi:hypothetical protein
VRTALHRLVAAGVLATRDAPGQPTRYRVTDALLGRGVRVGPDTPGPQLVAPLLPSPAAAPATRTPSLPAVPGPAPAFRMTLNGATVAITAGVAVSVELDADGVPHLRLSVPPPA